MSGPTTNGGGNVRLLAYPEHVGKDADCCDTCRDFGHVTDAAPVIAERPLRGGAVTLVIMGRTHQTLVLGNGEFTVGRTSTNAIPIHDSALSRRQCILRVTDERITVEDTKSTCGTYLDGRQTHGPTEVGEGSVISMGSTRIQIVRG